MNEFLARLERCLKHMDAQEKQDILQDYREHFEIGISSGKSEAQIARELGEPEQLARMFSAVRAAGRAHESRGAGTAMRMMGAFLSYKVGGGIMMAAVYFVCLAAMVALFAGAISLIAAGVGLLVMTAAEIFRGYAVWAATAFFAALMLGSGGALCWMGLARLWRKLFGALPLLARRMMQHDAGKKAMA